MDTQNQPKVELTDMTVNETNKQYISSQPSPMVELQSNETDLNDHEPSSNTAYIENGQTKTIPTTTVASEIANNENDLNEEQSLTTSTTLSETDRKKPEININQQYQSKNKWKKLLTNSIFCGRLLTLILTLLLLTLSITYCIAQLLSVKLQLITKCESKSREEIWYHSYLASKMDGEVIMNAESQYGLTDEPCWTTNTIDTNTDQLWYSNKYKSTKATLINHFQFAMFIFVSLYAFGIIIYNIYTMIMDIYYVKHNILHTKSTKYRHLLRNQQQQQSPPKIDGCLQRNFRMIHGMWNKYMSDDTTGWIVRSIINEIIELIIQSQALLLYNGYHILDADNMDDVYLANKPDFIVIFAIILSFNCFGSGILWLSYSLAPTTCYGLMFRLSIFFIDQFSDLFYTVFPFIIVLTDDYNTNTDIWVLLGQLNITSALSFVSAFMPLLLLCNKSLLIIRSTVQSLRNQYFEEWKVVQDLMQNANDEKAVQHAQQKGYKVNIHELAHSDKELYDSSGNFILKVKRMSSRKNWIDSNKLTDDGHKSIKGRIKQILLTITALLYFVFGIVVLVLVIKHINAAKTHCNSVKEQNYMVNGQFIGNDSLSEEEWIIIENNPELFFWDKCLYQTYPFTNNDEMRCQCRVFVIDWSNLDTTADERRRSFNLTQKVTLSKMLEHWIMLEKFQSIKPEGSFYETNFVFTSLMFRSFYMKAFEWKSVGIVEFECGISAWKQLEYLSFEDTNGGLATLPADFGGLNEMKYLSFISTGLHEIPSSICNFQQLDVLEIEWETSIQSIPHCIDKLVNIKAILIDGCFSLSDIPISIFNLPNLIILSLFKGAITYQSILDYNLPIYINDTEAINDWINDNFNYNDERTKYWLSLNPICDENITQFPSKLQYLINNTCDYLCDVTEQYDKFCIPRKMGDGRCYQNCNIPACRYDEGDCMQLCFAEELTNCSWDKLNNNKCDEGCDNKYCSGYEWSSDFRFPATSYNKHDGSYYSADFYKCPINSSFLDYSNSKTPIIINSNLTCRQSEINNIFIDPNVPRDQYQICPDEWVGDGECDDSCRTDECLNDNGDCDIGCIDDTCQTIYQFWLYLAEGSYKINHITACKDIWPVAIAFFDAHDTGDCNQSLQDVDYNMDKHINFREFVVISYAFSGGWIEKATQVNCSQCIGMQYYNI